MIKPRIQSLAHCTSAALAAVTTLLLLTVDVTSACAQGTAFSYEGRLNDGGSPANGFYDLQFTLYDSTNIPGTVISAPLTNSATGVSNGVFAVTLDFGSGVFSGPPRWLELGVRTNGGGSFTTLAPRQKLLPTPYAIYSANAAQATTAATANAIGSVAGTNVAQLNVPNTTVAATGTVVVTSGFITGYNLISGGSGYIAVPAVTVSDATGSNAVITASVTNGAVTGLAIQNAGNNYSANAKLIIAPPPSNAYQTFNSGNIFNGVNTFANAGNIFVGSFNGTFGNLAGGALTLSNNLTLPATTATAGVIYAGGATLMHSFGVNNFFAGPGAGNLTMTGGNNVGTGPNALRAVTSGGQNVAIGNGALYDNSTGNFNTAVGTWALDYGTGGNRNTGVGNSALLNNQTADNVAIGYYALSANTSGSQNTASGTQALSQNTVGIHNTASGFQALFSNTNGNYNVANGYQALYSNASGSNNTATGDWSLNQNTTGYRNTANGHQALYGNTVGTDNTAIGDSALHNNTVGIQNVAAGGNALQANSSGSQNVANGFDALYSNTSGGGNTANGAYAMYANTIGGQNTANGDAALNIATGNRNTADGYESLKLITAGNENSALGYHAGYNLTSGSSNVFIANPGVAGDNNVIRIGTPGTHTNTFIAGILFADGSGLTNLSAGGAATNFTGTLAGDVTGTQSATVVAAVGGQSAASVAAAVISANGATSADAPSTIVKRDASGSFAAANLTLDGNLYMVVTTTNSGVIYLNNYPFIHGTGENFFAGFGAGDLAASPYNVGVGLDALHNNTTGQGNTATGVGALQYNTTGGQNTANGNGALYNNTNGWYNTANGISALGSNTSGAGNTASGVAALNGNTTGNYNTAVGYQTLGNDGAASYNIALGFQAGFYVTNSNNIEIGNAGLAADANTIRLGTTNVHTNTFIAGIYGATAASGVPVYVTSSGQLGTLTSSARFKTDIQDMEDSSEALLALHPVTFRYKPEIDPQANRQFGLVAEEVEKVAPELVAHDDNGKPYTVRYETVNAMLLNEFLKEHRKVECQEAEIATLKARAAELQGLKARLDDLEKRISGKN